MDIYSGREKLPKIVRMERVDGCEVEFVGKLCLSMPYPLVGRHG
jgi:hypothetical protein